jgi:hypothetical protein
MTTKLADRVAELERDVQELKQALSERLPAEPHPKPAKDAWRKTVGIYKDEPLYDDVIRIGPGLPETATQMLIMDVHHLLDCNYPGDWPLAR